MSQILWNGPYLAHPVPAGVLCCGMGPPPGEGREVPGDYSTSSSPFRSAGLQLVQQRNTASPGPKLGAP